MRYRMMGLGVLPLALAISVGEAASRPASAQAVVNAARAIPAAEAEIRAADDAFVAAYNKGDAPALAAMFTEDAEVVESDGARYKGRELITRAFTESFAASKGARIALGIAGIRFVTPDVAQEEGRSVVTPASGSPVARYYTVLYVKREGRWLMASVREEADTMVHPRERLKELAWMVGDWLDESPNHVVKINCRWSQDGCFLIRDFNVQRGGKQLMTVTQRVGWDPAANEFHSWEFDSEGGFGEGRWARDGDRWIVKESGVRPEGVRAHSTRITVPVGRDQVRWTLLDRVIGGQIIPGEETSLLTRVPPQPKLGGGKPSTVPNTAPQAPNAERRAQ